MSTLEAAAVIGLDGESVLYWHLPPGRSVTGLPDSHILWSVYWQHRETMSGQAHTHPGTGTPSPSIEDLTSYAACERGLGRHYNWWIASMDRLVLVRLNPDNHSWLMTLVHDEPGWVAELRRHSQA